jgi:hypothetical protein
MNMQQLQASVTEMVNQAVQSGATSPFQAVAVLEMVKLRVFKAMTDAEDRKRIQVVQQMPPLGVVNE